MRRFALAAFVLLPALVLAADPPAAPKADKGKQSDDLPGPFHPFCVTGPYIAKLQEQTKDKEKIDGRFHCPVCDHGFDPIVLLFIKDLTVSDPLKDLLVRLDAAVEKNPTVRLGVTAVFLTTELPNVLTDDDKREELAGKLRDLAGALKLKNVTLALDSKGDLEKYDVQRNEVAFTVILARGYHVVAREDIPRDLLTAEKVEQLLKQVAEKFGAKRK
jgi:hypothetical protein